MRGAWEGLRYYPHAQGTYLGSDSNGLPEWRINGQVYTDTVSTVGGAPQVGAVYPVAQASPDGGGAWVAMVPSTQRLRPPVNQSEIDFGSWATFMQGPRRSPRVPGSHFLTNNAYGTIAGSGANNSPLTRIADGMLYFTVRASGIDTLGRYNNVHQSAPTHTYVSPGCIVDMAFDEANPDEARRDLYIVEWNTATIAQNGRSQYPGFSPDNYTHMGAGSRITRLDRETLAVVWSSPWDDHGWIVSASTLSFTGHDVHALVARRTRHGDTFNSSSYLYTAAWRKEAADESPAGHPSRDPVLLRFDSVPWQPAIGANDGFGYAAAREFARPYGVWGTDYDHFRNSMEGFTGAAGITWRDPTAVAGAFIEQSQVYNLFSWPAKGYFVPAGRYLQQFAAFDYASGSRRWVVSGFATAGVREFYSPIAAHSSGKLIVYTISSTIQPIHYGLANGQMVDVDIVRRSRHFLDVYSSSTGQRLSRTDISSGSITSMEAAASGPMLSGIMQRMPTRANLAVLRNNWGGINDGGTPRPGWPAWLPTVVGTGLSSIPAGGGMYVRGSYNQTGEQQPIDSGVGMQYLPIQLDYPPLFNPFNACLDFSGEKILFGPVWTKPSAPSGEFKLLYAGANWGHAELLLGSDWQMGLRTWLHCYSLSSSGETELAWRTPIGAANPSNWTFSNWVAYAENRAAIHFRQGAVAFVWLVNTATGALVFQGSYATGLNGTPVTEANRSLPTFDGVAEERLYAKGNALFTTVGPFLVTLRNNV